MAKPIGAHLVKEDVPLRINGLVERATKVFIASGIALFKYRDGFALLKDKHTISIKSGQYGYNDLLALSKKEVFGEDEKKALLRVDQLISLFGDNNTSCENSALQNAFDEIARIAVGLSSYYSDTTRWNGERIESADCDSEATLGTPLVSTGGRLAREMDKKIHALLEVYASNSDIKAISYKDVSAKLKRPQRYEVKPETQTEGAHLFRGDGICE